MTMIKMTDERKAMVAAFDRCASNDAKRSLAENISRAHTPKGPRGETKMTLGDYRRMADAAVGAERPAEVIAALDAREAHLRDAWKGGAK